MAAVQSKTRRRLRMLAAAMPVVIVGALMFSPAAFAGWFLPESDGSPNAEGIRTLYILIALIGLVIFIGVEGLLIYSMVKYRARKGRVAAQIHGNTQLEIGWTIGAAAILIFLTVFTFLLLPEIKNPARSDIDANGNQVAAGTLYASTDQPAPPGGNALRIRVVGQQYSWEFKYPDNGDKQVYAWDDMYVPIGQTVVLDIESVDVAHSWWIPPLGGKMDAIPGYVNKSWFKVPIDRLDNVDENGQIVYKGQCAELCGRNHANMLARVIALPYDDWKAWYDRKADELQQAKDEAAKEREQINSEEGQ
ncbi:MAG TPA: cytochrome c oxidase subunit II [Solirubrobacteraceae bacterium]|nr:cytochrome c oxidase subunit II [Solirubrobacteraceae bacterium]